jgi:uncharacterized protein (TIGR03435 family)
MLSGKRLLPFLLAAALSRAQSFDVASVKPVSPDTVWNYRFAPGGRTVLKGFRLRDLVLLAWRVRDFQVFGTTNWMDTERFNIEANATGNPDQEESRRMLQSLLADRFRLALHHETRMLQTYSLVPAKGGPKLAASRPGICTPYDDSSSLSPAAPALPVCGFEQRRVKSENGPPHLIIEATGLGMPRFARLLGTFVGVQVTDYTAISGAWDFRLEYADDRLAPGSDAAAPALFTALQEQLGLKLESRKGPVEVLVIDHAERPSAN